MAISINWGTSVINIPKANLTLVSGTLYELDTDEFRLILKNLEVTDNGMVELRTHVHNTQFIVAGTTFARGLKIINGYSITFEDGQYSVRLIGSNNNFFDVEAGILNQNQVQIIPGNSAGLIVNTVVSGSGVTEQDKLDIADRVWDETLNEHILIGSTGKKLDEGSSSDIIADAVWEEATADHQTLGTTGKALTDAGAAGNPWDTPIGTPIPGTYGYYITKKLLTFAKWIGLR